MGNAFCCCQDRPGKVSKRAGKIGSLAHNERAPAIQRIRSGSTPVSQSEASFTPGESMNDWVPSNASAAFADAHNNSPHAEAEHKAGHKAGHKHPNHHEPQEPPKEVAEVGVSDVATDAPAAAEDAPAVVPMEESKSKNKKKKKKSKAQSNKPDDGIERRRDKTDGEWYSKAQFDEFYGEQDGSSRWEKASV